MRIASRNGREIVECPEEESKTQQGAAGCWCLLEKLGEKQSLETVSEEREEGESQRRKARQTGCEGSV